VISTGVLQTDWGRRLFETAYWMYKRHYETGSLTSLRKCVRPGYVVVDVGANIGYFTLQFASWFGESGNVLAIEPEALNYARLHRAVMRAGFNAVGECGRAGASGRVGAGFLQPNPMHPADHKLGTTGGPVSMITIDSLLAARSWPKVSLIKIDVQGAE